ncbi:sulfurtransferase [Aquabacterium lacunae]|uniref:Sulfurtransferase n=1 Tax=Aquabacterium lacunae TaxID=2528630 RepID=A0A4Q9H4D4_9BURK|nr:sulfurtransferase [Aquabacterium lacunae]TBO31486.1 sulfurtransferase [Aquabacterium lacunae]
MHSPPLSPLISASALRARLSREEAITLLDCRFNLVDVLAGQAAFGQGHIPGAVYAHLDFDLSGPKTGQNGRHPLPTRDAFAQTLTRWGVQPGRTMVCYDAQGGMFAARAWWMLHWAGHTDVQVLDGGWAAWQTSADDATAAGAPADAPLPDPALPSIAVVSTADVLANLEASAPFTLLDARAPDRFRGENETLDPVGGHIPGALNRFFQQNLQADGRFKPAAQLRAEFTQALGTVPAEQVVHQCGSGVTACHNLLAMTVAGLPGSRLYAGSWSEWCSDPSRPAER